MKFELAVEVAQGVEVWILVSEVFRAEFDRKIGMDRHELLGENCLIAMVLEPLAIALTRNFVGTIEGRLERSELSNQLQGAFFADTGHAGHIVDRIASVQMPPGSWTGTEVITFRVSDGSLEDTTTARFTVLEPPRGR